MKFLTLLFLPLVFLWPNTEANLRYKTGDALYVYAHSGLTLRDKPSKEGAKILTVPNQSMVEVIDANPFQVKYSAIEACGLTINGHWVKVTYNGKQGYLFDGYLLPYKPIGEQSVEDYWTEFSKVKSSTQEPPADNDVNYYSYLHTVWENGVEFLNEGYEGGNSSTLTLPKSLFTYQEAYLFGLTEIMGYKENPYTCKYNPETQVTECMSTDDMGMAIVGWDGQGNLTIQESYAD